MKLIKVLEIPLIKFKIKNPSKTIEGFIAPVPGLEPGTHGLTVHCSNQLSYTGKA